MSDDNFEHLDDENIDQPDDDDLGADDAEALPKSLGDEVAEANSDPFAIDEGAVTATQEMLAAANQDSDRFNNPFANVRSGEKHIAIWGTTQSGKTVFLATLRRILVSRNSPRPDLAMAPANRAAVDWLGSVFDPLFQFGVFPGATEIDTISFPMFNFSRKNENDILFQLTFIDGPGEMFRNPNAFADQYNLPVNPLDYLRDCKGLLMLVDPTRAAQYEYDFEYEALANNLRHLLLDQSGVARQAKLSTPVAFCLSKCDEPRHRPAIDDPQAFLNEYFGDLIHELSTNICQKSRWFASSALGFEPNHPTNTYIRWDGRVGIRNPREIRPLNVAEPFLWLIDQLNMGQSSTTN